MKDLTSFDLIAFVFLIIGGINWGSIALFNVDIVSLMFGELAPLSRVVYGLVGISAVYLLFSALTSNAPQEQQFQTGVRRTY